MNMTVGELQVVHHLPAEWSKQSGVLLTWPHEETIWAETLAEVDSIFAEVAKEIALREKVLITCSDKKHGMHVISLLRTINADLKNIRIYYSPSNDVWVRDHGPITVFHNEKPLLLDFIFNGWGNKYESAHDNQITKTLQAQNAFGKTSLLSVDMVLEGGAIEVDGHGTLMTTSSCLLSESRNPILVKKEIEERLHSLFGIKKILWLDHGYLSGDDTDGHIDTLARFINPHTICYITCDDTQDPHYEALKQMEAQLRTFTNFEGKPYQLVPLPWPKARYADFDGRRLPASYANFLIINDAVLVPTYADPKDIEVIDILAKCFPDRKMVPIHSLPIIQWYGSLHCMTMQLPDGVLS